MISKELSVMEKLLVSFSEITSRFIEMFQNLLFIL